MSRHKAQYENKLFAISVFVTSVFNFEGLSSFDDFLSKCVHFSIICSRFSRRMCNYSQFFLSKHKVLAGYTIVIVAVLQKRDASASKRNNRSLTFASCFLARILLPCLVLLWKQWRKYEKTKGYNLLHIEFFQKLRIKTRHGTLHSLLGLFVLFIPKYYSPTVTNDKIFVYNFGVLLIKFQTKILS